MNVSPELKESLWNNSDVASGIKEAVKENKHSLWFWFTHNKRNKLLVTWGVRIDIWKEIFLSSDSYFIFVLAVCIQRLSFFNVYITFFFLLFCWLVVCTCGHREDGWNMGHDSWSCVLVRALWLAAVSVSCWVWERRCRLFEKMCWWFTEACFYRRLGQQVVQYRRVGSVDGVWQRQKKVVDGRECLLAVCLDICGD